MFFWVFLLPLSLFRLWNEIFKSNDKNLVTIFNSSFTLLISIVYIIVILNK